MDIRKAARLAPPREGHVRLDGIVRVGPLMSIPAVLHELGVDPEPLFESAGFDVDRFGNPEQRIPYFAASRLIARRRLQEHTGILGESSAIQEVLVKIEQMAPVSSTVLVEGESLLNDGIAIVLFNILLVAALGTEQVGVAEGVLEFLWVFLGGAALGAILGLGVAEIAGRLGRLPSTALTVALAYGAFAAGEEILGFSGVMASVSAGLVLAAFAHTLIPNAEVETWHTFWESFAFIANGVLFLLIGVVIDAGLIVDNLDAIAIAILAVAISRPLAIFPVMPLVTRLTRLPEISRQNELVLVWGGLRGGVALALALSIPDALPEQETFVAMTAAVAKMLKRCRMMWTLGPRFSDGFSSVCIRFLFCFCSSLMF